MVSKVDIGELSLQDMLAKIKIPDATYEPYISKEMLLSVAKTWNSDQINNGLGVFLKNYKALEKFVNGFEDSVYFKINVDIAGYATINRVTVKRKGKKKFAKCYHGENTSDKKGVYNRVIEECNGFIMPNKVFYLTEQVK